MMIRFPRLLLSLVLAFVCLSASARADAEPTFSVGGEIARFEQGALVFKKGWSDPGSGSLQGEGWGEYVFEVPADGWYGLYFKNMPELAREVFIDGRRVSFSLGQSTKTAAELAGLTPAALAARTEWTKEANLPLAAGRHVLRLERLGRMGFPAGLPRAWEIRAVGAAARDRIAARLVGAGEVRAGEKIKIAITGGAGDLAMDYEIVRVNRVSSRSESVARVRFYPSAGFETKVIEIPMPEEGVFEFLAKGDGQALSPREFLDVVCYVVDTRGKPAEASAPVAAARLVANIDCVRNTLNGAPVVAGANYWEANGATRVSRSSAGEYRESGDGFGPEVEPHPKFPAENFPGFAYRVDVPEAGRPYLIEIDHPDDDWRSVCVPIVDILDAEKKKAVLPPAYAYETGGNLALSGRMLTQRILFWPNGHQIHFGLVSSRPGKRAAAASIRVSLLAGPLPSQPIGSGRIVGLWMEEPSRWHTHFNTPADVDPAVREWIGLNRTMEWIAYRGMNAFWPQAAAYQNSTYDSAELKGYLLKASNMPRLSALLCEKHGLSYVPEIFFAGQRYFDRQTIIEGAANPAELYTRAWWGFSRADDPAAPGLMPSWNILHPRVQAKMIAIYGELADKLADSPAFVGMSGRLDAWQWNGYLALTSLNWGYEDWTTAEFARDTGIAVPGAADDPTRFEKRYRFLTSPEMKPKWVAWRCRRVTDFYQRLVRRIQQARPGTTLILCGSGDTDETHRPGLPSDIRQRLAEMGVDFELLARTPDIAVLPTAFYGRGKSFTYLADQRAYDDFFEPANLSAGFNATRGLSAYGSYQEWAAEFPLAKLGAPLARWWYCSGSDAAGDNLLERMAVSLAAQDTLIVRDGGYPLLHGQDPVYSRWMREFSSLPRAPFTALPGANDPVAVWTRSEAGRVVFYAVNRDRRPAEITLKLASSNPVELARLGSGEALSLERGGKLTLRLDPFELRAFRASAGTRVSVAENEASAETVAQVRELLSHAKVLRRQLHGGIWADSLEPSVKRLFESRLEEISTLVKRDSWTRARAALASAPMMTVYEKTGRYPTGLVAARFPDRLEALRADRFEPDDPFVDAEELFALQAKGGAAVLTPSESFNAEWAFASVLTVPESGLMELDLPVPASGRYTLSLGYVGGSRGGEAVATLNGKKLALPLVVRNPGQPDKIIFPEVELAAGTVRLGVRCPERFGIYALKLAPRLRPLDTTLWSTVGPFPSEWHTDLRHDNGDSDRVIKAEMELRYPPELDASLSATYAGARGPVGWRQTDRQVGWHEEAGVNFAPRSGIASREIGFAQTFIVSPEERTALLYIGADWWANAWLNGELIKPIAKQGGAEKTGAWFVQWKPRPALVHLKKGVNRLLVKSHGGSMQSWFVAYLTDAGDLRISAVPE